MGTGAGYDPSVMPSSMIPAQTALDGGTNDRPHVISHLFGFGGITRHRREARDDRQREQHACRVEDYALGDGQAVAVNMDIDPVEKPETVLWIDPTHPQGGV